MGEIKEGQKAKLFFKMADNSEKEIDCFVKEVQSDRLALNFSSDILEYSDYLEEGQELPVKIFTPLGVKAFDTIILNSPIEQDFVIEFAQDSIQIQRREYTRVMLETKVIIEREHHDNIVTKTLDISGGGIRFIYGGGRFEEDETLGILLYLPYELHSVKAKGKLIKSPHLPLNQHVLLFDEIAEKDRDKIIKKCFELQVASYGSAEETVKE